MRYRITVYPNVLKPNQGHNFCVTLHGIEHFLTKKRPKVNKKKMVAWCPATFTGKRAKENCDFVYLMVFDIDQKGQIAKPDKLDTLFADIHTRLKNEEITHIIHSSYSSTLQHNKFRIIFPLAEPVPSKEWTNYYKAACEIAPSLIGLDVDSSTCDSSRAFFTSYYSENFQYESFLGGNLIDWAQHAKERKQRIDQELAERKRENERRLKQRRAHTENLDGKHPSHSDYKKYMYDLLEFDFISRHTLAGKLGAKISGNRAEGFTCPDCNRNDVTFFYVEPYQSTGLYCGHVNSCGDGKRPKRFSAGYVAEFWGVL